MLQEPFLRCQHNNKAKTLYQFHSMTNSQANIDVIQSCIQTSLNYPRHIFTKVLETLHKDLSQGSTALNSHCKYLPPLYLNIIGLKN